MSDFRLWYRALPAAMRVLLTINVVAYLLWQVVLIHIEPTRAFVWEHLALNPELPGILFEPWQLLTYGFLHLQPGLGGLLHILFNMLWLYWIGRDLESLQGPSRLFGLYVLGAVGGALLTVILRGAFPGAALFSGTVHGASGAVLAVMTGVAVLYPYKRIALLFIGSVRLIHIVIAFLALDVLFLAAGGTSVSAHLGGVLTGLAFARLQQLGTDVTGWAGALFGGRNERGGDSWLDRMERWLSGRSKSTKPKRTESAGSNGAGLRLVKEEESDEAPEDVDRILDKISEQGYDALTAEEKRILYEASGN